MSDRAYNENEVIENDVVSIIKNIKQLYNALNTKNYEDKIANIKINDFLVTKKNCLDYSNFCSDNLKGLKLVELGLCKFYSNVDEKKHLFYCVLPYDRDCEHKPKIKLDFSNNYELYHKINGYYRDYQRNNAPATILVLGEFKNYECIIRSEKQIVTIKKPKY